MSSSAALSKIPLLVAFLALILLAGCFSARGLPEIRSEPYPIVYQDDGVLRFGDRDDSVFLEVRRAPISKEIDNLAIHYPALFPDGVKITPEDREEYVTVGDRKAYRVVFRTTHIRKRKRLNRDSIPKDLPEGWTLHHIVDPESGSSIPVLHGPIIPREQILYLVEGRSYIYYIFMRADGDGVGPARRKLEKLLEQDIDYG
jgi:hypothetical protein